MTPEQIRREALSLEPRQRSDLIQCLLDSFDSEVSDAVETEWIEIAQRRFQELTSGAVSGIPADEVFARVRQRDTQA